MTRVLCGVVLCAGVTAASAVLGQSRPEDKTTRASRAFTERVQAYLTLQKGLEAELSTQKTTADVAQITSNQQALATAVVAARRDSHLGDVFTPDVAQELREGIRKAFRGSEGRDIRRTILESDPAAPSMPRVNEVYPEEFPVTTMPPTLLRRLPILPGEMVYRIVGRSLVLQDSRTNLIVDVLPNAIPMAGR
ncbi:MAG TPA: hypothetical protein VIY56_19915 [Vicinamibacterales bacterium]